MGFIREMQAKNEPVILPGDISEFVGEDGNGEPQFAFKTKHWREMSLAELRAVRDMAENLYKRARDRSEAQREADAKAGKALAENIEANTRKRKRRETKLARETDDRLNKNKDKHGFFWEHL